MGKHNRQPTMYGRLGRRFAALGAVVALASAGRYVPVHFEDFAAADGCARFARDPAYAQALYESNQTPNSRYQNVRQLGENALLLTDLICKQERKKPGYTYEVLAEEKQATIRMQGVFMSPRGTGETTFYDVEVTTGSWADRSLDAQDIRSFRIEESVVNAAGKEAMKYSFQAKNADDTSWHVAFHQEALANGLPDSATFNTHREIDPWKFSNMIHASAILLRDCFEGRAGKSIPPLPRPEPIQPA